MRNNKIVAFFSIHIPLFLLFSPFWEAPQIPILALR